MGKRKRVTSQSKAPNAIRVSLDRKEQFIVIGEGIGLAAILAWLFFDSVLGLIVTPLTIVFCARLNLEKKEKYINETIDKEFKELLIAVSDALSSGYSIENAFRDAQDSLQLLYGDNCQIMKDIKTLNQKIAMRVPAEKALVEFANDNPTEETLGFANVFSFARRLGGGYVNNLRRTIEKMEEKIELKQDIRAQIAEKQMEFNVMTLMPVAILVYVKLSSKDFLSALYRNPAGIAVMFICLGIYVLSIFIGRKIVNICV